MAGKALSRLNLLPAPNDIKRLRAEANVQCIANRTVEPACRPLERPCLFNTDTDPCEQVNLADKYAADRAK